MRDELEAAPVAVFFDSPSPASANPSRLQTEISYREVPQDDSEVNSPNLLRCRLDCYTPVESESPFATLVWFHGGGLSRGERVIPLALRDQGIAVVAPNYRLSPEVAAPVYLEDAAAAVAWTFREIESLGGSREKILVSGHSAGGYLASMIALDPSYLAAHGVDANNLAGVIPFSGHTITHFTIRKENGISGTQPRIDRFAPLFHLRKGAPPMLLFTGDRELELLGRYEENAYFARMMKVVGHPSIELIELEGFDHGAMPQPAFPLMLEWVNKHDPR
ncbi:MAG: alpha/beta hydrolase [Verrucomicrobiota bacterium]